MEEEMKELYAEGVATHGGPTALNFLVLCACVSGFRAYVAG
jgi:hypothetical protein